jgi:hypothetical protein
VTILNRWAGSFLECQKGQFFAVANSWPLAAARRPLLVAFSFCQRARLRRPRAVVALSEAMSDRRAHPIPRQRPLCQGRLFTNQVTRAPWVRTAVGFRMNARALGVRGSASGGRLDLSGPPDPRTGSALQAAVAGIMARRDHRRWALAGDPWSGSHEWSGSLAGSHAQVRPAVADGGEPALRTVLVGDLAADAVGHGGNAPAVDFLFWTGSALEAAVTGMMSRRDHGRRPPRRRPVVGITQHWSGHTASNTWSVVALIEPHAAEVVVSNPLRTRAIAEAKVKTDRADADIFCTAIPLLN